MQFLQVPVDHALARVLAAPSSTAGTPAELIFLDGIRWALDAEWEILGAAERYQIVDRRKIGTERGKTICMEKLTKYKIAVR